MTIHTMKKDMYVPPIEIMFDHSVLVVPTGHEINRQGCEDVCEDQDRPSGTNNRSLAIRDVNPTRIKSHDGVLVADLKNHYRTIALNRCKMATDIKNIQIYIKNKI